MLIVVLYIVIVRTSVTLFISTGFGRKEVVEYIIKNGARVDAQDDGMLILFNRERLSNVL